MLDQLVAAIDYFDRHPDPACVEPLLRAMGSGDANGGFAAIISMLANYDHEVKRRAVNDVLSSSTDPFNREWVLEFALLLQDRNLLPHIRTSLASEDELEREVAAEALHDIACAEDIDWIVPLLEAEQYPRARKWLEKTLENVRSSGN